MRTFHIRGRVIGEDNLPLCSLYVFGYDADPILHPDDFLGESVTDTEGYFEIHFDQSKFSSFYGEVTEGTPDIYLVIKDYPGQLLVQTRGSKTKYEIEVYLKIAKETSDPDDTSIYNGNAMKMLRLLNNVGNFIEHERSRNIDVLRNGNPQKPIIEKIQHFNKVLEEAASARNNLAVILYDLVDFYSEELSINLEGFDGPQVPRQPRKSLYHQIIMRRKDEKFPWG